MAWQNEVYPGYSLPRQLTYSDYQRFDTNKFKLPIGLNGNLTPVDIIRGDLALSIGPTGYGVYRRWFNRGGIRESAWGGGPFAACSGVACWNGLHHYISPFVSSSGEPIVAIDQEDLQYQTPEVQALYGVPSADIPTLPDEFETPGGGYIPPNVMPDDPLPITPPSDDTDGGDYVPIQNDPIIDAAGKYCVEHGGTYTEGLCILPTGYICNAWDYKNGICPAQVPPSGGGDVIPQNVVCTEGEYRCSGTTREKCTNNAWVSFQTNSSACGYVPPGTNPPTTNPPTTTDVVCVSGTTRCAGTTKQQCQSNAWYDYEQNSASCGYTQPVAPSPQNGINSNMLLIGAAAVLAMILIVR